MIPARFIELYEAYRKAGYPPIDGKALPQYLPQRVVLAVHNALRLLNGSF